MSGPTKFEILQIIEMRISAKPYLKWVISDIAQVLNLLEIDNKL